MSKEIKKVLSFDCDLTGKVDIDRDVLIRNVQTEHRSYANHSMSINGATTFNLPELQEKYGKGFKLGIVVHLPDNASGKGKSKEVMSL